MDEEGAGGARHPETSCHFTPPFSARSLQPGKKRPERLPGKPQGHVYLECFVPRGVGYRPVAAAGGTSPVPPAAGQGTRLDEPLLEHLPAWSRSGHWLLSGCFCSSRSCGILREIPGAPKPLHDPLSWEFYQLGWLQPFSPLIQGRVEREHQPQEDHKPQGNTSGQSHHTTPSIPTISESPAGTSPATSTLHHLHSAKRAGPKPNRSFAARPSAGRGPDPSAITLPGT